MSNIIIYNLLRFDANIYINVRRHVGRIAKLEFALWREMQPEYTQAKSTVKLRRALNVCKIARAESKACQNAASLSIRGRRALFSTEHSYENETARCEYYSVIRIYIYHETIAYIAKLR